MKILVISDLHLCDIRHKNISDGIRLEKLAKFIASSDADAVLNLGDTVSRKPLLTEPDKPSISKDWSKHWQILITPSVSSETPQS